MRRVIFPFACACALLALPESGAAKEIVEKAKACGASECRTEIARDERQLPAELIGPTIQIGRKVPPPPHPDAEPSFAIKLWSSRDDVVRARYLPGPEYLRGQGNSGPCGRSCLIVPRRWVHLTPSENEAYADLAAGVLPLGPADPSAPRLTQVAPPLEVSLRRSDPLAALPLGAALALRGLIAII